MPPILRCTVALFCGLVLAGLPLTTHAQQAPDDIEELTLDIVEDFLPDQLGNATLETLIEEDLLMGGRYQDDAYDTPLKFGFLLGSPIEDAFQTLHDIQIEAVVETEDWSDDLWSGMFDHTGELSLRDEDVHYFSTGSLDAPDMAMAMVDEFLVVGLVDGPDSAERLRNAFESFDFTTIATWMPQSNYTLHSVPQATCLSTACMVQRLQYGEDAIFNGGSDAMPIGSIMLGMEDVMSGHAPLSIEVSGMDASLDGKTLNLELTPELAHKGFEAAFLTPFTECIEGTASASYNCHGDLMEALNE